MFLDLQKNRHCFNLTCLKCPSLLCNSLMVSLIKANLGRYCFKCLCNNAPTRNQEKIIERGGGGGGVLLVVMMLTLNGCN